MQSFLSEIHVVPHRVRAGSVTLSRVGKINLSLPDHGWSAAFPSRRMTRYLDSVGMSLRCGCSRQWPEKKDKSMSAPLTKFRTQAFDPHQMPSYSLIYSINGVIIKITLTLRDFDKLRKTPLRDYYDDNATGGRSRVGSTKTTAMRGGGGEEEDDDDSIIDVAVVDVENDVERKIAEGQSSSSSSPSSSSSSTDDADASANAVAAPTIPRILRYTLPAIGIWLCSPVLSMIDTAAPNERDCGDCREPADGGGWEGDARHCRKRRR